MIHQNSQEVCAQISVCSLSAQIVSVHITVHIRQCLFISLSAQIVSVRITVCSSSILLYLYLQPYLALAVFGSSCLSVCLSDSNNNIYFDALQEHNTDQTPNDNNLGIRSSNSGHRTKCSTGQNFNCDCNSSNSSYNDNRLVQDYDLYKIVICKIMICKTYHTKQMHKCINKTRDNATSEDNSRNYILRYIKLIYLFDKYL